MGLVGHLHRDMATHVAEVLEDRSVDALVDGSHTAVDQREVASPVAVDAAGVVVVDLADEHIAVLVR